MTDRYEHKIMELSGRSRPSRVKVIDAAAREGWRLLCTGTEGDGVTVGYFERRKAVRTSETVTLLVRALTWFDRTGDGKEGIDYQNGDSGKYPGDAWKHADRLRKDLRVHLAKAGVAVSGGQPAKK